MEVMHERNAHNFPLDLAAGEVAPVALTAPHLVWSFFYGETSGIVSS